MRSAAFCVFMTFLTGCGGGGVGITGKVIANGEKVTAGNITFSPASGGSEPVTAIIQADGTYSANGVTLGKNKVVFAPAGSTETVALQPGEVAKPAPFTGFTVKTPEVEVKSGGSPVDIELVGPPAQ